MNPNDHGRNIGEIGYISTQHDRGPSTTAARSLLIALSPRDKHRDGLEDDRNLEREQRCRARQVAARRIFGRRRTGGAGGS